MTDMTPVTHEELVDLVRRAPLSFSGTVTRIGGTSLAAVPVEARNDLTAVVRVDQVLHAPEAFRQLAGNEVTVQLAADAGPMAVGEAAAFFTRGMVYGEGLGVTEVARLPVGAVLGHISMAAASADELPFSSVQRTIRNEDIAAHAAEADAVVVGTVTGLEDLGLADFSEHAPHWWRAGVNVSIVERGAVEPGPAAFVYPSSTDIRWRQVPNPNAGQEAVWLLHSTEGSHLAAYAPFRLLHHDDVQPVQKLAVLSGTEVS
ncbi:hypothetical protein ACIRD3_09170 [Kitasatospora sp. NPDC093550]|uniref:hypothetical protein n=1 Tax=Kitasatospora sp. NPDC093550 TaxID=3364089 RepID=UPI00380504C5